MDLTLNISKIIDNTNQFNKTFLSITNPSLLAWNVSTMASNNRTWFTKFGMSTINTLFNSTNITSVKNSTTFVMGPCFDDTNNIFSINMTNSQNRTAGPDFNTSLNNGNANNCTYYFNSNHVKKDDEEDFTGLISDAALEIIVLIDYAVLSGIICLLGIIFNVINAIIFYRLGFGDTINIMLFSLAITDLGALLPLLWKAVLFNPWFHDWDDVPFDYMTFQYYTGGWPHACFANISCLIIAFVTLDRCLCIAMPLKVRSIITPRRTVIIIAIFYAILTCSLVPLFSTVHFGPIFFDDKNTSLISLVYTEEATFVENITLSFYTFNQLVALVAVILFTTILVVQLKKKSAWRMKTSSAKSKSSNAVGRDTKIVKLVLFISVVYIICYVPGAVNIVVMIFMPDYSLTGRYKNICTMVWAKLNIFEAFNSTINIFIYLKMSSKYAQAFNKMFGRAPDRDGGTSSGTSRDGRSERSANGSKGSKNRRENSSVSKTDKSLGQGDSAAAAAASNDNANGSNNCQRY